VNLNPPWLCAGSLEPNGLGSEKRAVIIINAQSIIQVTNDAVANVLGHTRAELKGKPLRCILPPSVADHHYTYVRNYIQSGDPILWWL
jgi:PAS domain S-box-containing protein